MKILRALINLTLLGAAAHTSAQTVTARVDRDIVSEGETFQLIIESSGQDSDVEPDLEPLNENFDVLGRSKSTQVKIVNGKTDSGTHWQIVLAPKTSGALHLPPLRVGNQQTEPVAIKVVTAQASAPSGADRELFLEVESAPDNPYVQAQLTYTVRLLHAIQIHEGSLSEPNIKGAVIERLGNDVQYETRRNGRRYRVTERRYAVFPQASGRLEIPAPVLDAEIADDRSQRQFGSNMLRDFFPATRRVRVRGQAVSVEVRPRPVAAPGASWLPAESLDLSESWSPDPPVFRVGEPVTRTITALARGLTGAQLPELPQASAGAVKLYPDQPLTETQSQGVFMIGKRVQKVAMVPTRPGDHTLPELLIHWWDTGSDQPRTAKLPARTVTVLPGTPTTDAPPATTQAQDRETPAPEAVSARLRTPTAAPSPWTWVSGGLLLAWLATLVLWRRERRGRDSAPTDDTTTKRSASQAAARRAIERACAENDAPQARDALLAWAGARWPERPPRTLISIATRLEIPDAASQLRQLDRCLYLADASNWDGSAFLQKLSPALARRREPTSRRIDPLPMLYPPR